jgi:hypothetical protein
MIIRQTNRIQFTYVVSSLKRTSMALLLLTFFITFFALTPIYVNAQGINSKTGISSADVQVDQIIHTVEIHHYGSVVINDTFKLSPKNANTVSLQNFSVGFPSKYGNNLDYCFAYNASNPNERLKVGLDTGLGGQIGFYGVNVTFPEQGVTINSGGSYTLTVIFAFSNLVSSENATSFNLDFPKYPSLTQNASLCNVTVVLPPNANYTGSDFSKTTLDNRQILKYAVFNLTSFQSVNYTLPFSMPAYTFPLVNINEIDREISLDQWGGIHLSDSYDITNKGPLMGDISVTLPKGATGISAWDGSFNSLSVSLKEGNASTYPNATITFPNVLEENNETKFTVGYSLPWKTYVNQYGWRNYNLSFAFFEGFDWTIRKLTVTITLPNGADFQSAAAPIAVDVSKPGNLYDITKSVFQETVAFAFLNVTPFYNLNFNLTYGYVVFWASFYPTLWVGLLVMLAFAIAFFWRAPRPTPVSIALVPAEDLKSFVEAHEGKTRILLELDSMENQLRKGRISRRQYKVRRKTLEGRLSVLSRDLASLRERIRSGGGRYADIMRQIEVAETMLEGAEKDTQRVEARYRRGEISKEAYGKLLQESHRRREKAKTTIDEVLLRLREEIR